MFDMNVYGLYYWFNFLYRVCLCGICVNAICICRLRSDRRRSHFLLDTGSVASSRNNLNKCITSSLNLSLWKYKLILSKLVVWRSCYTNIYSYVAWRVKHKALGRQWHAWQNSPTSPPGFVFGAVSLTFFSIGIQIWWKISLLSHPDSNTMIATKFSTWHDSCAVVACAEICCDLMASNGITARRNFHQN